MKSTYWTRRIGVYLLFAFSCICTAVAFGQDGKSTFADYCAGCHGAELQGGLAGPLIKTDWNYGRRRGDMIRNVTYGIADTEMIAWGEVLSKEEIRGVVNYIVESQTTPPTAERQLPTLIESELMTLKVEVVVDDGLAIPWGIDFIDANRLIISERSGQLRWIVNGKLDSTPIRGTPKTVDDRTGGYMDVIVDPNYAENRWIYLAHSFTPFDPSDRSAPAMTRIVRGRVEDHEWVDQEVLFQVADSLLVVNGNRWGCRFLFDVGGHLFFTIGDMARGDFAQNLDRPAGKIFRIWPDGSVPNDNPFVDRSGALSAIYSFGNRNVQGLAIHPTTQKIWFTEHGPMGGDELNVLEEGGNFGWPIITYGVDYSGEIVSEKTHMDGMIQPIMQWTPSIAISPALFVDHPNWSTWQNDLLVGALAYEEVRRIRIKDEVVTHQELILKNLGRIRDLHMGPDGNIYILSNNPDRLIKLVP
ncbi:MAG: glucose sorbosone dehydrogenase [Saprospiraceae bacterium]|nr:glucose sorbosone dehydrogenase [Saprospiraceae bacterium]